MGGAVVVAARRVEGLDTVTDLERFGRHVGELRRLQYETATGHTVVGFSGAESIGHDGIGVSDCRRGKRCACASGQTSSPAPSHVMR